MSTSSTVALAVLTAVLGTVAAGYLGEAVISWYHIYDREGGSGYLVLALGLLGGLVGLIVGLVIARLTGAGTVAVFFKGLGISFGVMGGIVGIAAVILWALADIPPKLDGSVLDLVVEIRLPKGEIDSPAAVTGPSRIILGSSSNEVRRAYWDGKLDVAGARLVDGRWVVTGSVLVFTTRGFRTVELVLGGKARGAFWVPLPRRPTHADEQWSDWLPRARPGEASPPETELSFRFRVQKIVPLPPPPDAAQIEAEQFAAIKPDAPLSEWMRFLHARTPTERYPVLVRALEERPIELAAAIRSPDQGIREKALHAVALLPRVAPEVAEAVRDDGRAIAEGLRQFNALAPEDPKYAEVGSQIRSHFNEWHHAWWTVNRKTEADGRPLLREILELTRVHPADGFVQEIELNGRVHLEALEQAAKKAP